MINVLRLSCYCYHFALVAMSCCHVTLVRVSRLCSLLSSFSYVAVWCAPARFLLIAYFRPCLANRVPCTDRHRTRPARYVVDVQPWSFTTPLLLAATAIYVSLVCISRLLRLCFLCSTCATLFYLCCVLLGVTAAQLSSSTKVSRSRIIDVLQ